MVWKHFENFEKGLKYFFPILFQKCIQKLS